MMFSVIIPTYNRGSFISNTIKSVLNQTYSSFEIIVVDDGSTDDTEEIVKSINDRRIRYYKTHNQERGAARNFGVDNAKGDYVSFLDSDDILYENCLSNAVECINGHNYPVFFHLSYEIINGKKKITQCYNPEKPMFLVKGNPLSCIGVFIKREVFKTFRFNEDRRLSGSEDWELWLRLFANYGLISHNEISGALIQHSTRSVLNYDEIDLVYRKNKALESAFRDDKVEEVFSQHKKAMDAYLNSYISLHLALSKKRKDSLKYLLVSVGLYPSILFSRRFFAIVKHLF